MTTGNTCWTYKNKTSAIRKSALAIHKPINMHYVYLIHNTSLISSTKDFYITFIDVMSTKDISCMSTLRFL